MRRFAGVVTALAVVPLAVVGVRSASVAAVEASGCAEVSVGSSEVVLDNQTRLQMGLGGFPETALGVLPSGDGSYTFHSVNAFGGRPPWHQANVVTRGSLANPVAAGVVASAVVPNSPLEYAWVGGGPMYRDAAGGTVLQVLHLERHYDGRFYSELALGRYDPVAGVTTYLGVIVRPSLDFERFKTFHGLNLDIGVSSLTVLNGHLHVYFPDASVDQWGNPVTSGVTTARAPLADVLEAAQRGAVTPWRKYHRGGWESAGLGGASSDLLPVQVSIWHPYVARTASGGTVMVAGRSSTEIVLSSSPDGVGNWSVPRVLFRDPDRYNHYATLVGTGPDPSILDDDFYLFHSQFLDPATPDLFDMQLVRRKISCVSGRPAQAQALVRSLYPDGRHRVGTQLPTARGAYPEYGGVWGVLNAPGAGTRALFGCRAGGAAYFISIDPNCDGTEHAIVRTEGWLYTDARAGTTPLFRCRLAGSDDRFVSIRPDCEGAVLEGQLGHALGTSRVVLSRFYDGRDHWTTTGPVTSQYLRDPGAWYIEAAATADTRPLYGCLRGHNRFVSLQPDCEGAERLRLEGHLGTAATAQRPQPVYRCYLPWQDNHFVSADAACEGAPGAVSEGTLGYVSWSVVG